MTTRTAPICYRDNDGSLEVTHVSARCSIFVARGRLTAHLGEAIAAEGLRLTGQGHAVALHDWSGMTSYDTAARQICTDFMLTHRRAFESVTILVGSALIAMGVNVANIGLGGFLHATTSRADFEARLRHARSDVAP